jgi:hypothetical protein
MAMPSSCAWPPRQPSAELLKPGTQKVQSWQGSVNDLARSMMRGRLAEQPAGSIDAVVGAATRALGPI